MNFSIETIKNKMLVKYPFFGSIVANVEYKENKKISTSGTDGKTIYYNKEFLDNLKIDEQIFIFAHEVCHIAFNHILRSEGKEPDIWNIATDGVINQFLKKDGLKIIEGGVDIADAINYDAEQLYEKLLEERKQNQQQNIRENSVQNQSSSQQQNSFNSSSQNQESSNSGQVENSDCQNNSSQEKVSEKSQSSDSDQQKNNDTGNSNSEKGERQKMGKDKKKEKQNASEDSSQQQNSLNSSSQNQESSNSGQVEKSDCQNNLSQEKVSEKSQSSDSDQQKNNDVGHDTHSMWEEAVKKYKAEQEKAKSSDTNSSNNKEDERQEIEEDNEKKEQLEKTIEEISKVGEKEAFKKNREEKRKELEALKQMLSRQAMDAGKMASREQRIINDIGISRPIIDWRYVLRETIKYDVDWSYRNAYIEDGIIRPSLEYQPMPETEIVLDTSGSIDETLLRNFLRECKNILKHSKVKVGCFDTEFYGFHEIRTNADIETMKLEGGGGTDFDVAVNAFTRRVENKIIFTDGWANMPEKVLNVVWIVFGNRKINPVGGKVIYIDNEQLNKLYNLRFVNKINCKTKKLSYKRK